MKSAVALVDLEQIEKNGRVYLSPAGNASEKFFEKIKTLRKDIKVLGFIDTYKSGQRAGLNIFKLDEMNDVVTNPVIVLIERKILQQNILKGLAKKGIENLFYVEHSTVFSKSEQCNASSVLYVFYDLSVNALNFEYLNSLCHAECMRLKLGLDYIHPIIVPQHSDSVFDLSRTAVVGKLESDNSWFMDNVVTPSNSLLPSVCGFSTFSSRAEVEIFQKSIAHQHFPENYSINNPVELDSSRFLYDESQGIDLHELPFRASNAAKLFVVQWLQKVGIANNEKMVIITLREVAYQTQRNSDNVVWKEFADNIKALGYTPVFIRDTYAAFNAEDFSNYHVFSESSWNIYLRIAIYELAYLNMMSCTGPHVLCTYNKRTRYIIFNTLRDDGYVGSKEYLKAGGVQAGQQYFARRQYQQAVWGMDNSSELIMEEFVAMVNKIEK